MDDELEVMRLVRIPPRGQLIVIAGNRRYEQIAQVESRAVKQRLIAAVGELITFAGGYEELVDAGVAPPILPASEPAAGEGEQPLNQWQAAFLASLEREKDAIKAVGTGPLRKQQLEEEEVRRRAGIEEVTPALSIVEEIDGILQSHLAAKPEFKGRSIHLAQDPAGGLRIEVDDRYYKRPGDIDDPEVRQVIHAALQEWEKT